MQTVWMKRDLMAENHVDVLYNWLNLLILTVLLLAHVKHENLRKKAC